MDDNIIIKILVYVGEGYHTYHIDGAYTQPSNITRIVKDTRFEDVLGIPAYNIYRKHDNGTEWLWKRIEGLPVELTFQKPQV